MTDENEALRAFGRKLRELRSSIAISQEELSDRAGLDRTYVSGCERGKRNPSLKTIIKLAKALDMNLKDLFDA